MKVDSIILGAGISGLVVAYRLKQLGQNVLVLEHTNRVGGAIQSRDADGFLIEQGPNSLRGAHELLDLVEELNLIDELVTGDPKAPAYVYSGEKLHAVPMGPGALFKSKLISGAGKWRLFAEPFIKGRPKNGEESIASFIRRRLGHQVLEKLVAPFLSGVYAGDPERLSVQACFPKLAEFEADAGSIVRGGLKSLRAARQQNEQPKRSLRPYRLCSFRNGLNTLPQRLAQELGSALMLEADVRGISKSPEGFELAVEHQAQLKQFTCSTLIVATPADAAARLLAAISPSLSSLLSEIPYASLASVPLAYRVEQLGRQADGFGFLAPRSEGLRTLGSIWNSSLFTGRAPEGWVLTTNFIGGATDPEAVTLSDDELISMVHTDLSKALGISGEARRLPITRYERAIPQYEIGHAARVARLEAELQNHPGLRMAGNYLHGVAIGDCIRQAEQLATEIAGKGVSA
ncbi:MAG: protoporphyrinogen oxidase [Blastocatellales bacterium]